MTNNKTPRLTLVGAGPGDPELLTRKGWKALQSADVVLYDALAGEALLADCPASAKMIYVGKRAGQHSMLQEDINRLIVQMAWQYGHVVRLKGGDPFVFGRGYEEVTHARANGLAVTIVPGISSATGLTALQTVPLTHRSCARSFWVLTATTREGHLSDDLQQAVHSPATVIILMGMRKIAQIARLFAEAGRKDLPVLIIQNGSRADERHLYTTVEQMVEDTTRAQIAAPGIIVLGDVVGLAQNTQDTSFWQQLKSLRA